MFNYINSIIISYTIRYIIWHLVCPLNYWPLANHKVMYSLYIFRSFYINDISGSIFRIYFVFDVSRFYVMTTHKSVGYVILDKFRAIRVLSVTSHWTVFRLLFVVSIIGIIIQGKTYSCRFQAEAKGFRYFVLCDQVVPDIFNEFTWFLL